MIKIDKNIGRWIPDEQHLIFNVKYIDDVAYHIYCQYRKNRIEQNITPQIGFIQHKKVYIKFYNDANLLIRFQKLNNIKDKTDGNIQ